MPELREAPKEAFAPVLYVGSFPVTGPDQATRAENVRCMLRKVRANPKAKAVLLAISIAGIKVCTPDGTRVLMAHALRRISYATCEPAHAQFGFLAREPNGHFNLQYCHSFHASSSQQAEELNSIVGNAFRMAYASQLQEERQDGLSTKVLGTTATLHSDLHHNLAQQLIAPSPTQSRSSPTPVPAPRSMAPPPPPPPPTALPTPLRTNEPADIQRTPDSDESNSPTDLNSYRRLVDKPPLIKRLAFGLGTRETTGDDVAVNPPLRSPSRTILDTRTTESRTLPSAATTNTSASSLSVPTTPRKQVNITSKLCSSEPSETKSKRISQVSSCSSAESSNAVTCGSTTLVSSGTTPTPPPLPERFDSLVVPKPDDGDLRSAPWFQAGIPREIALEILSREPVGAFMVRESTTKVGCFALSLRVPRDFQPAGIAHYLIQRTHKGYKIKGFTKEFSSLLALITHHSVMPELLPVPLALSRHTNPPRSDANGDLVHLDASPDYSTIADFRKMMSDLNV